MTMNNASYQTKWSLSSMWQGTFLVFEWVSQILRVAQFKDNDYIQTAINTFLYFNSYPVFSNRNNADFLVVTQGGASFFIISEK